MLKFLDALAFTVLVLSTIAAFLLTIGLLVAAIWTVSQPLAIAWSFIIIAFAWFFYRADAIEDAVDKYKNR
jgi:hypothetical protein